MRLKDQLLLRKIAGQYVIVPIGRRILEIHNMVQVSESGAYLWDFMKKDEFTVDSLVQLIMEHYVGAPEEVVRKDIEGFLEVLKQNKLLQPEPGEKEETCGHLIYRMKEKNIPEEIRKNIPEEIRKKYE